MARLDEGVVGFAYIGPSDDGNAEPGTAHVYALHVDPDLHRHGIGRRLLDEAIRRFAATGHSVATLWVVTDNWAARQFYERVGWACDGTTERQSLSIEGDDTPAAEAVRYRRVVDVVGQASAPKYYELRQWLRAQVDGMPPGTPVAPERALSQQFNVSRTTVRQALHDLAVEGRIVRQQGRGTFVAPPKVTQPMRLSSYTSAMEAQGRRRIAGRRRRRRRCRARGRRAARRRRRVGGRPVERLRYADDEPMAVETVYLDHARFSDIGNELSADVSLYALLESRYGVVPAGADETIETVLAPPAAARLLGTDAATPMLLLTRSTRDASGRPVEYVRSLYRGDRFRFSTHLTAR